MATDLSPDPEAAIFPWPGATTEIVTLVPFTLCFTYAFTDCSATPPLGFGGDGGGTMLPPPAEDSLACFEPSRPGPGGWQACSSLEQEGTGAGAGMPPSTRAS